MRKCIVNLNGVKAGELVENDNLEYEFSYYDNYLESEEAQPVSLTLPLTKKIYREKYLFPAFTNILSEGENRALQARLWHLDPEDDFGIMLKTCQYDTIGAITITPL